MTATGRVQWSPDYGKQQPTLFNPKSVEVPKCTSCGTTRVNLCRHDADQQAGLIDALTTRPRGCLNTAQNRDGIPYS